VLGQRQFAVVFGSIVEHGDDEVLVVYVFNNKFLLLLRWLLLLLRRRRSDFSDRFRAHLLSILRIKSITIITEKVSKNICYA